MELSMQEIIKHLKDFSGLFSTALILALAGVGYRILKSSLTKLQSSLKQKDSTIEMLKEKITHLERFSMENTMNKVYQLQELYKTDLNNWVGSTLENLQEEKNKAVSKQDFDYKNKIETEILNRQSVTNKYLDNLDLQEEYIDGHFSKFICGNYSVTGKNRNDNNRTYYGKLEIEKIGEIYRATWTIEPDDETYSGVGLLKGKTIGFLLVENEVYNGIVLYEIINNEMLYGHWIRSGSSQLSFEECLKLSDSSHM
jgi:hypothetical protein